MREREREKCVCVLRSGLTRTHTEQEEQVMDGRMTITLNAHREICAVQKAGAPALSIAQILACARAAAVKVAEISELLHKALLRDTDARSLFPYPFLLLLL